MTVSGRTSGPDLCYRLIWPTEKAETDKSGPEGSPLKLAKSAALLPQLGSTRCCVNMECQVGSTRVQWRKSREKKSKQTGESVFWYPCCVWVKMAREESDPGWVKIKKRPKIILQSAGIRTRPTETHNPGCVQIWIGKNRDLKCLKS